MTPPSAADGAVASVAARWEGLRRWLGPVGLLATLGLIVAARTWATRAGLDALAIGAVFGLALIGTATSFRNPFVLASRSKILALGAGVVVGLGLLALATVGAAIGGSVFVPGLGRPAAPFLPWVLITILVAGAEEAVLRGRLFDATQRAGGVAVALLVTTVAFALMHVPLYGWHVVPLDLAVGVVLGGLRLATGGIVAPAAAHAVADLGTWWL